MSTLVYGISLLKLVVASCCSDTENCLKSTKTNKTASLITIHTDLLLFEFKEPADWCEAYHFCKQNGYRLASIMHHSTQNTIRELLLRQNIASPIWVGGRKKDFGGNWTWIDDSLGDCENVIPSNGTPSAAIIGKESGWTFSNVKTANKWLCSLNGQTTEHSTKSNVTWFEAQNRCHILGGRLSTRDEIDGSRLISTYWIGLYRNPWIWVEGDGVFKYRPVVFSAWKDDKDRQFNCMILDSNHFSDWSSESCEKTLNYVLCMRRTTKVPVILVVCLIAVFGITLTLVVVVFKCNKRRRFRDGNVMFHKSCLSSVKPAGSTDTTFNNRKRDELLSGKTKQNPKANDLKDDQMTALYSVINNWKKGSAKNCKSRDRIQGKGFQDVASQRVECECDKEDDLRQSVCFMKENDLYASDGFPSSYGHI